MVALTAAVVPLRPKLTPADIADRRGINPMHVDYSRKKSAWIYDVEGVPGLKMWKEVENGQLTRRWSIDFDIMPSLEAALSVINGEKSIEEAKAMVQFAPPAVRPKLSLTAQIAEIDYELQQRKNVYGRIASGSPSRKSELEQHVENLKAVRATLVWLQDNEAHIKQRMSY